MPSRKQVATDTKARLTLAQLASYDDVLTDVLVDRAEFSALFKTTIRKNRSKYFPIRGIQDETISKILLHTTINEHDPVKTEEELLNLSGLRKYVDRLSSPREREHFRRHLRKYVHMYLPDCPWEISTTNRYTIDTHEAAVTARRNIRKGEVIKYLSGTMVAMTPEEEEDLDLTRRDFSIVMSSRKKTPLLFLGPARFANHDCNANGKLVTRGSDGMEVVAARNIGVGDEITVSYGEDYFGTDNRECLCATCEDYRRNGWANTDSSEPLSRSSTPGTEVDFIPPGIYSLRKKRKYESETESDGSSISSAPRKRRAMKRVGSKLSNEIVISSDVADPETVVTQSIETDELPMTPISTQNPIPSDPVITEPEIRQIDPSDRSSSSQSASEDSRVSTQSTAATSPTDTPQVKVEVFDGINSSQATRDTVIPSNPSEAPVRAVKDPHSDTESVLSELPSSHELDDVNMTVLCGKTTQISGTKRNRLPTPQTPTNAKRAKLILSEDITPKSRSKSRSKTKFTDPSKSSELRVRIPGDYFRTPLLLAQPYDRWVLCHTCPIWFVQSDGYLTRKECPRCERHSKLNGYQWPETEKSGLRGEERVLDHRTVHRFVDPEEERSIKRRGRGTLECGDNGDGTSRSGTPSQVRWDALSDRADSVGSEVDFGVGLRTTRSSSRLIGRGGRVTL